MGFSVLLRLLALSLSVPGLFTPAFCLAEDEARGPVEIYNQHPLAVRRLALGASTPEIRSAELRLGFNWTNSVSQNQTVLFDAESRITDAQFVFSPSERLELDVLLPFVWRGGGVLDNPIEAWHRFFGLPNGDRDEVEEDQFQLAVAGEDGEIFNDEARGFGVGDLRLSAKYLIAEGRALSLVARAPTGGRNYGGDGLDLGARFLASERWEEFVFYGGAGFLHYFDSEDGPISYRQNNWHSFLNLEYLFSGTTSLQLGANINSHPLDDLPNQLSYQAYLDFGVSFNSGEKTIFDFIIRENLVNDDSSVDVTFHLGLRRKFGEQ